MTTRLRTVMFGCFLFITAPLMFAGGPILVGGPASANRAALGVDGKPFTWNPARMPITYRVDPGPLAVNPSGKTVIDNTTGLQRVKNMFGVWQAVSTASLSFTNAGALLPAGSYTGKDLTTAQQYNDVIGSCKAGLQNPVIFDGDGKLMASLGLPPEVIGFNSSCKVDVVSGYITASSIVINGKFQDGVSGGTSAAPNYEMTANELDEAITHEIGHFLGLDHSQINLDILLQASFPCDVDGLAGLPLMFPIALCQARKDVGFPVLSTDDVSWISRFYPKATFVDNYGTISGVIYFPDGVSAAQGVNVIARLVDDPNTEQDESRRVAVSVVSGYLFTGNPGQCVTASLPQSYENNTGGSAAGSRDSSLIGYNEIAVPPGTYTVEVETVDPDFVAGSSVGPLDPPIVMPGNPEFWNHDESAFDFVTQRDTITIHGGDNITGIDIILNGPANRFDQFEDDGKLINPLVQPTERRA
jgi:hypothetical protein